jgi:hypothetical protein
LFAGPLHDIALAVLAKAPAPNCIHVKVSEALPEDIKARRRAYHGRRAFVHQIEDGGRGRGSPAGGHIFFAQDFTASTAFSRRSKYSSICPTKLSAIRNRRFDAYYVCADDSTKTTDEDKYRIVDELVAEFKR